MALSRKLVPFSLLVVSIASPFAACATGVPSKSPAILQFPTPAKDSTAVVALPGLHNVVTYADGIVCGGAPDDEEGMRSLAGLGIKTVISVDGMTPDVPLAAKYGMHYVHLPISYDKVPEGRQLQLAQAISSCAGPIYMHCHHGKHRSAAALASAVVLCGKLTPDQAIARMQVSGTAKEYQGLWDSVRHAHALPADQLHVDPATLPSVTQVKGMVSMMNEIDQAFDFVKRAQKVGWKAPDDHPDLVASHETARLAATFARIPGDPDCRTEADFVQHLNDAVATAKQLDAAVRAHDAATADQLVASLGKSCKACHAVYRDR